MIDSFEGNCPDGWETVFERVWNGLEEGCLYDYTKATEITYKQNKVRRTKTNYEEITKFLTIEKAEELKKQDSESGNSTLNNNFRYYYDIVCRG